MFKMFFYFLFAAITLSNCTNLDERHEFNYKLKGSAKYVDQIHVVMGPGVNWKSSQKVILPVEIKHDIYGKQLDYLFEVQTLDTSNEVILEVIIDDQLIEQKSEFIYDSITMMSSIKVSGVFSE